VTGWLGVVVYDLEEVMFAVLEDHVDTFVFENDLDQVDEIGVGQFRAKGYFTDGGLGEASVLDCLSFFVGLEFFDGEDLPWGRARRSWTCTVTWFGPSNRFIDTSVGATADEAHDLIVFSYFDFARISSRRHLAIQRV
jgi:hypothetical protein